MPTLRSLFDLVLERRARSLIALVRDWLPSSGRVLDLGSGTGHASALLQRDLGLDVQPADVSDFHTAGPPPVLIGDGALPFADDTFASAILFYMLAYPEDPVRLLAEAARVTRGPVIVVQTLSRGTVGRRWHRAREFVWTAVGFQVAKAVGYVPRDATFSMSTRRFYSAGELERDIAAAGLRVAASRARALLPGGAVAVVAWRLERSVVGVD